ncbi:MAG: prephenate dehydrogenase [Aeoliella sp.]
MPPHQQVAIVGVGLLGGSIGLALRERGLAAEIVGVGRHAEKLDRAAADGIIDRSETDLATGIGEAEVVVVCTPVEVVATTIAEVARHAPASCLVTDVASTKVTVVAEVESVLSQVPGETTFIGSHPLAGDHRSGAEFARADLFAGKTVVVTPTTETSAGTVDRAAAFWQSLGAKVVQMSPEQHDAALAVTSHLPHLVASALSLATTDNVSPLVATGWLDTTRVAAADAALWRQIFASNRGQVLVAVEQFSEYLERLRTALAHEDDAHLEQLLAEGKRIRDAVGN